LLPDLVPVLASRVDFRPVRLLVMRLPGFIIDRPGARGASSSTGRPQISGEAVAAPPRRRRLDLRLRRRALPEEPLPAAGLTRDR
jgi:hypothetical protein